MVKLPHVIRRATALRRSVHFVPATNEKFLQKALAARADTVVLDLEDSVVPEQKAVARETIATWAQGAYRDAFRNEVELLVRVNPLQSTSELAADADLVRSLLSEGNDNVVSGIMLPKVKGAGCLDEFSRLFGGNDALTRANAGLFPIATETALGLMSIGEIAAHPAVFAMCWGCEDLSADLGSLANRSADTLIKPRHVTALKNDYLDVFKFARVQCLLAAKAHGVSAVDGVFTDLQSVAGCEEEARDASVAGYDGKLTIHPEQISAVHAGFAPSREEYVDAKALIEAAKATTAGAFRWKGQMVDRPHFVRAQKLISRGAHVHEGAAAEAAGASSSAPSHGPSGGGSAAPAGASPVADVHHGLWFDEMDVGQVIPHALTRTVTETDNIMFTTMTLNPARLHLDYASAEKTQFKKPLVNSMFTHALLVGMSVLETTHGTTIANLGFESTFFPKPLFYGDTVSAHTTIVDKRESKSNPTRGVVKLEHTMFNHRGEVVCKSVRNALMLKKPGGKL